MATEKSVAESAAIARLAGKRIAVPESLEQLSSGLSVDVPVDTEILEFTYLSTTPHGAQLRAQSFASAYLLFRRQEATAEVSASKRTIDQQIDSVTMRLSNLKKAEVNAGSTETEGQLRAEETSLITQIGILQQKLSDLSSESGVDPGRIVQEADLPQGPARPSVPMNAFIGLLAGCVLGLGGALAREYADDRVRSATDLESLLRVPVLTTMAHVRTSGSPPERLVALYKPDSVDAERFRQLRTNLVFASLHSNVASLLVTSAREEEGKTFVAANLSVALAKAGKRVILVSADLRRPRLEDIFQAPNAPGLVDVLLEQIPWSDAVLETGVPNLGLLSSGSSPSNPTELVGSSRMVELIRDMRRQSDYVVVDTGPLLPVADASATVPACDGVLFVASEKKATRGNMVRSREQLARVDANVLGAVLLDSHEEDVPSAYVSYGTRPLSRGLRLLSRNGR
jgi:capsular exopolysaccharide synthesis family protein